MEQHVKLNKGLSPDVHIVRAAPVYFLLLFLPHTILYMLMSNLQNVTWMYALLVLYTAVMCIIFIEKFEAPMYLLYHLMVVILFQNAFAGLGMSLFHVQNDGNNLKLLMVYKEVYALMLIALLWMKYRKNFKLIKYEWVVPLFVIFMGISFVISPADTESKFYYLRGFAIIFVSYFLGRLIYHGIKRDPQSIQKVAWFVIWLGVLTVAFGYLFMFVDRSSNFWKDFFSLGHVMVAKGTEYTDHPDWATPLGSLYIPRMFSFVFDAIMASYFIMTALVCTYFIKDRLIIIIQIFLLSGLLFTLGKGAMMIWALILMWTIPLYNIKLKPKGFIAFFVTCIFAGFFILKESGVKSSIIVHFNGFIEPLLNSPTHPIGNGLGNGGVYFAMKNNILAYDLSYMGAESFFGAMLYQLGYPGTFLFMFFVIGCIRYLLKLAYSKAKIDYKYIVLSGIMFSLFIISLFQEATFGINYTGILVVFVGYYISHVQAINKKNELEKQAAAV